MASPRLKTIPDFWLLSRDGTQNRLLWRTGLHQGHGTCNSGLALKELRRKYQTSRCRPLVIGAFDRDSHSATKIRVFEFVRWYPNNDVMCRLCGTYTRVVPTRWRVSKDRLTVALLFAHPRHDQRRMTRGHLKERKQSRMNDTWLAKTWTR